MPCRQLVSEPGLCDRDPAFLSTFADALGDLARGCFDREIRREAAEATTPIAGQRESGPCRGRLDRRAQLANHSVERSNRNEHPCSQSLRDSAVGLRRGRNSIRTPRFCRHRFSTTASCALDARRRKFSTRSMARVTSRRLRRSDDSADRFVLPRRFMWTVMRSTGDCSAIWLILAAGFIRSLGRFDLR